MDFKANYPVVGAFVIILGVVGVVLTLWLSSRGGGRYYEKYMVFMDESVYGLAENTPVKFNGVDVGFVRTIRLNPKNYQQVVLVLDIDEEVPVTEMTVATLKSQGITGLTYIGLEAEMPNAPLVKKKKGEPYPVIKSSPSFLVRLDSMLQETSDGIKKLAASMQQVFDDDNQKTFRKSLKNIERITQTFAQNSQQINNSIESLEKVLAHLAEASTDFKSTLAAVKNSSVQIGNAGGEAKIAMQSLSQQILPAVTEVAQSLKSTTTNLERFSSDLRANPAALIWGKQLVPLGPGER